MPTLNLGVLVVPYRTSGKKARSITTGDVAHILEKNYGLMAAFARVYKSDITSALMQSAKNALESKLMGARDIEPFGKGTQEINQKFRYFINSMQAEKVGIPGTPTAAALAGVNHRKKHPYAKRNARRPSFRDTGLFSKSFRSWVE